LRDAESRYAGFAEVSVFKKIPLPDRKLWTKNGNGFSMASRP
jgi:hypothetical protein